MQENNPQKSAFEPGNGFCVLPHEGYLTLKNVENSSKCTILAGCIQAKNDISD
jgi:hypothetical protein